MISVNVVNVLTIGIIALLVVAGAKMGLTAASMNSSWL